MCAVIKVTCKLRGVGEILPTILVFVFMLQIMYE
jgi:hypothetical protein